MARFALPHLKKTRGPIVNIGSKVAETGQGGTSAYAAANGGRNALTREWAVELAKYEIRVNSVIVAECWTPLYAKWIETLPDPVETRRRIEARIPFGKRMTTCDELFELRDRMRSSEQDKDALGPETLGGATRIIEAAAARIDGIAEHLEPVKQVLRMNDFRDMMLGKVAPLITVAQRVGGDEVAAVAPAGPPPILPTC